MYGHVIKTDAQKEASYGVVDIPHNLLIYSSQLELNKTIGQGQYGIVYKAYLQKDVVTKEVVAVKTLKGFSEKDLVTNLLHECVKMSTFNHPNVLNVIGMCLDGGHTPYVVMPFMINGDLLSYLKKERNNLVIPLDQELDRKTILILMDICLQVAKGMEYLSSMRVVHRDLACRNCMIDFNFIIKVADFGLSETIDPLKDYFRQGSENCIKLPVKWLSPESLNDGVFSEKTDVWAFGVSCWEVFSGGKMPYAGVNPADIAHMLESGYRMDKPVNLACLAVMFEIMMNCWEEKPEDRPTFTDLVASFSQIMESEAGYISISHNDRESDSFLQ